MSYYSRFCDHRFGPCIDRLPGDSLFLTFDDGPHPACTPEVLDVLDGFGIKATFFVIAQKAAANRALVEEVQTRGHAIGNHSLDHTYTPLFSNSAYLRDWILRSENLLRDLTGRSSVGFRSPAGVRTPPLHQALKQLNLPLIHWNIRFFDTVKPWTPSHALASLAHTPPGSIILLHDTKRGRRRDFFIQTLKTYLEAAHTRGLRFGVIPSGLSAN